mgnify:CR=1 FL=1
MLSGPAGGVVGTARTAEKNTRKSVIGFDMGGTSTDVCHYAGQYERQFENEVNGVKLNIPMMAIETVAAGGGSVVDFDGVKMRVGPESAGSNPGPACYKKGGPLTVTDCNVLLGKIRPGYFPKTFPSHEFFLLTPLRHMLKFLYLSNQSYNPFSSIPIFAAISMHDLSLLITVFL